MTRARLILECFLSREGVWGSAVSSPTGANRMSNSNFGVGTISYRFEILTHIAIK